MTDTQYINSTTAIIQIYGYYYCCYCCNCNINTNNISGDRMMRSLSLTVCWVRTTMRVTTSLQHIAGHTTATSAALVWVAVVVAVMAAVTTTGVDSMLWLVNSTPTTTDWLWLWYVQPFEVVVAFEMPLWSVGDMWTNPSAVIQFAD